jgi:hypothetical protein
MIPRARILAIATAVLVASATLVLVPASAQASNASSSTKVIASIDSVFRSFAGVPDLKRNAFIDENAQQLAAGIAKHGPSHLGEIVPGTPLPATPGPGIVIEVWAKVKSSTHDLADRVANQLAGGSLTQVESAAYNYGGVGWVHKGSYIYSVLVLVPYLSPPLDEMFAGLVTLSGSAKVGATITAHVGTFKPAAQVLFYAWTSNRASVGTDSPTYTPQASDVGHKITVAVTGTSPGFVSVTSTSKPTKKVVKGTIKPPVTFGVSGARVVGVTLKVPTIGWTPTPTLTFVWYRDGKRVGGATASSYLQSASDVGHKISVTVTAKSDGYATFTKALTTSAKTKVA